MRNGNEQRTGAVMDISERRGMSSGHESGNGGTVSAFVGKGVGFKGDIRYEGTVRIDGLVEGEIHTTGSLIVGEDAIITAQISAGTVISRGTITGDIVATDKVTLLAPSRLTGSVSAPLLSMEEGVLFSGQLTMPKPESPRERDRATPGQGTPLRMSNAVRPAVG